MTELTREQVKEVALRLAWASEVGGYINRLLDHDAALREKLAAMEKERDAEKERCRIATQIIIAEIGASGPESLESAIGRILAQLTEAQARLKQMGEQ